MIQSKIAYAAGGIDIPSLPEEIQVALNQVLAGEIELTDFISQMNQFQFSGVYTKFAPEDVVPEFRERVSKPLWSRNVGTLDGHTELYKGFYTSSTQYSQSGQYYLDVYNASPNLIDQYGPLVQNYPYMESDRDNWVDAEVQFAVAFGQYLGHGSLSTEATDNSATKAIYSQYRNILLDPGDDKFTFDSTKLSGGDTDNVFFINVNRARYKEKLDPGNWELELARPSAYLGEFMFTRDDRDAEAPNVLSASSADDVYLTSSNFLGATDVLGGTGENKMDNAWNNKTCSFVWISGSGESVLVQAHSGSAFGLTTISGQTQTSMSYVEVSEATQSAAKFTNQTTAYIGTNLSASSDTATVGSLYRHYGHEGFKVKLTDSSKAQLSHRIKAGQRVFDVISGSVESEADLGAADFIGTASSIQAYGLFYPDIGVFALNGDALTASYASGGINLPLNVGEAYYDADGKNVDNFFYSIRDGYHFQARSEETVTSTHFFCRIKNKQYNFSNNNTYYTASDGSFTNDDFFKNPRTYITTVGMYNDANELLAVAKLSRPLLKSFDREAVIKVKLDF